MFVDDGLDSHVTVSVQNYSTRIRPTPEFNLVKRDLIEHCRLQKQRHIGYVSVTIFILISSGGFLFSAV